MPLQSSPLVASVTRTRVACKAASAALLAAFLALGTTATAQSVTVATAPVGVISVRARASSDVFVSFPLLKPYVYAGGVGSVNGNVITTSMAPGWTPDEFKYVQGSQATTYYCEVASGSLRGAYYTITSNSSGSLTVDTEGEDISAPGAVTSIRVRAYWTLATLFPPSSGFPGSPTFTPVAEIHYPNTSSAGSNLSPVDQFYYYTGNLFGGPGWRRLGSNVFTLFDNTIILPDLPLRIRNRASAVDLFQFGEAPVSGHRVRLATLEANRSQDIAVSLKSAERHTLASLNLIESGAFAASPTFTPVDTLLVFDSHSDGFNKSPLATYYYYSGSSFGGPGWRRIGANVFTIWDNLQEALLVTTNESGAPALENRAIGGLVIRRAPRQTVSEDLWTFTPSYAPN